MNIYHLPVEILKEILYRTPRECSFLLVQVNKLWYRIMKDISHRTPVMAMLKYHTVNENQKILSRLFSTLFKDKNQLKTVYIWMIKNLHLSKSFYEFISNSGLATKRDNLIFHILSGQKEYREKLDSIVDHEVLYIIKEAFLNKDEDLIKWCYNKLGKHNVYGDIILSYSIENDYLLWDWLLTRNPISLDSDCIISKLAEKKNSTILLSVVKSLNSTNDKALIHLLLYGLQHKLDDVVEESICYTEKYGITEFWTDELIEECIKSNRWDLFLSSQCEGLSTLFIPMCIEFGNNDFIYKIYEKYPDSLTKGCLDWLLTDCVRYNNYEIFMWLKSKGAEDTVKNFYPIYRHVKSNSKLFQYWEKNYFPYLTVALGDEEEHIDNTMLDYLLYVEKYRPEILKPINRTVLANNSEIKQFMYDQKLMNLDMSRYITECVWSGNWEGIVWAEKKNCTVSIVSRKISVTFDNYEQKCISWCKKNYPSVKFEYY